MLYNEIYRLTIEIQHTTIIAFMLVHLSVSYNSKAILKLRAVFKHNNVKRNQRIILNILTIVFVYLPRTYVHRCIAFRLYLVLKPHKMQHHNCFSSFLVLIYYLI